MAIAQPTDPTLDANTQPLKPKPLPLSGIQTDPAAAPTAAPVSPAAQAQTNATVASPDPLAFTDQNITPIQGPGAAPPVTPPLAPQDPTPTMASPGAAMPLNLPPVGGSGAAPVTTDPNATVATQPAATPYGTPQGSVQYDANGDPMEAVWNPATGSFAYKGTAAATAGPAPDQLAAEIARTQGIANDPTSSSDIVSLEKQRLAQLQGSNPGAMYGDQSGNTGSWQANNASPTGGVAPQTDGGALADQMAQENRWLGSAQTAAKQTQLGDPTNFAATNGTPGAFQPADPYKALVGGQTFTDPAKALTADQALAQSGGLPTPGTPFGAPPTPTNQLPVLGADLSQVGQPAPSPATSAPNAGLTTGTLPPALQTLLAPPSGPSVGGTPTSPGVLGANPVPPTDTDTASGVLGASNASPQAGVSLTPTDPNNPLTAQTIAPSSNVDRVKQFQNSLQSTIQNVLDPAMQARQVAANRFAFGAGRGVSGQARTTQGNIQSDYGNQIANLTAQGLANANTGSIDDMYKALGIAQQQQGFQANQEQNAFGQAVTAAQLQDQLTNSAFGRATGQEQAGYANSPSDLQLALAQLTGAQGAAAGNSAAQLFGQLGASNNSNDALLKYLQQLYGIGG